MIDWEWVLHNPEGQFLSAKAATTAPATVCDGETCAPCWVAESGPLICILHSVMVE
jgi:hypothetical protein